LVNCVGGLHHADDEPVYPRINIVEDGILDNDQEAVGAQHVENCAAKKKPHWTESQTCLQFNCGLDGGCKWPGNDLG
jgi:hypothetical protein